MTATSVTGVGQGESNKPTTKELAAFAEGPSIIFTGITDATDNMSSPPTAENTVVFPYVLAGGADAYVVMLTSINAGATYISNKAESDGNFTGFTFVAEAEGSVMYLVAKVGSRPNI